MTETATLDRLIALQKRQFVEDLNRLSPTMASWANDRLAEGFRVAEVQRVLSELNDLARRSKRP
jgi:hypothetical protein